MFKKLRTLTIGLLAVVFLAGCSLNPFASIDAKSSPQEFLENTFEGLSRIESARYDLALNLDTTADGETIRAGMNGTGGFVLSEDATRMSLDGSLTINAGEDGTITLEDLLMRVLDNKLYFRVGNLSMGEGDSALIQMFLGDYIDQWFFVDGDDPRLSEELEAYLMPSPLEASDEAPQDNTSGLSNIDVKKFRDILSDHNPLRGIRYEGNEKVDGTVTDIISFNSIDPDATIALLEALEAELEEELDEETEKMSAEEREELREMLKNLTISGKFWIGRDDQLIRKSEITARYADGDEVMNMTLTLTLTELNRDYAVTAPTDAQDFMTVLEREMSGLFGGFGGFDGDYDDLDGFDGMGLFDDADLQTLLKELENLGLDNDDEWSDEEFDEFLRLLEGMDLDGLEL